MLAVWKIIAILLTYGAKRTDVSIFFFPKNTGKQVVWCFLRLKYSETNNKMKDTRKSTEHVQFIWAILIRWKMLA